MRVVAGQWRGRTIEAPQGRDTRPTSDRVREAVASAVLSRIGTFEGVRVLDLFAGSGALGIEALSRGAAHVTFVDSAPQAAASIRSNLDRLCADPSTYAIRTLTASRFVAGAQVAAGVALLFADPPYRIDAAEVAQLLEGLARSGSILPGALVVYEHASGAAMTWPEGFTAEPERTYGDTGVSLATYEGGP